jgi:hypothetical protein
MPPDTPDWKRLELIVADIQRQLAPNADVRHNQWVDGRSGRRRKLDVTVTQMIGAYTVFVVLDCKRRKRPAELKDVAAFAEQVHDVNGNLGVMISGSGYDAGARAVAAKYNMILQTFRDAGTSDWQQLIGEKAWCTITGVQLNQVSVSASLSASDKPTPIPFDTTILDDEHAEISSIKQMFWDAWKELSRPVGDITIHADFGGEPSFVRYNEAFVEITDFDATATLVAKLFPVNLHFAEGKVLENIDASDPAYRQLVSESFEWRRVMSEQPSQEVSPEEYKKMMSDSRFVVDLKNAKNWLRFVVTQSKAKSAT